VEKALRRAEWKALEEGTKERLEGGECERAQRRGNRTNSEPQRRGITRSLEEGKEETLRGRKSGKT
jgi:hypothetical protein